MTWRRNSLRGGRCWRQAEMDVDVELSGDPLGPRGKFFSQYPQPPAQAPEEEARGRLTSAVRDDFLANLEVFIDDLSAFIRSVQSQEVRSYHTTPIQAAPFPSAAGKAGPTRRDALARKKRLVSLFGYCSPRVAGCPLRFVSQDAREPQGARPGHSRARREGARAAVRGEPCEHPRASYQLSSHVG